MSLSKGKDLVQVELAVPERYLLDETPADFAQRVKLYAAILMYRAGELSGGAAAAFAEVDRFTFLAACKKHGVSSLDYAPKELSEELEFFSRPR